MGDRDITGALRLIGRGCQGPQGRTNKKARSNEDLNRKSCKGILPKLLHLSHALLAFLLALQGPGH